MNNYQLLIASLPTQEAIIYYFLKKNGWSMQTDVIKYRSKDEARTRELLGKMQQSGILKSKYTKTKVKVGKILSERQVKLWNIKHK